MAEQNKSPIRRALERWNQGDLEGYLQIYDPQMFWKALPGVQIVIDDVEGEGHRG